MTWRNIPSDTKKKALVLCFSAARSSHLWTRRSGPERRLPEHADRITLQQTCLHLMQMQCLGSGHLRAILVEDYGKIEVTSYNRTELSI